VIFPLLLFFCLLLLFTHKHSLAIIFTFCVTGHSEEVTNHEMALIFSSFVCSFIIVFC
jgi:hypothetical protein